MNTSLPVITEANADEFYEALVAPDSQELFSVDLIAANPDVARQVTFGGFEVRVHKIVFEGSEYFVAVADDGVLMENEDPSDWVGLAETEPEARAIADEFIMDWKHNWGLTL